MPYLAKVRDGNTGEIVNGYWTCHIAGCEPGRRRMMPLHLSLWSHKAPDFESENTQILNAIDTLGAAVNGRGIWVMDRGGDRENLLKPFLELFEPVLLRSYQKPSELRQSILCRSVGVIRPFSSCPLRGI